MLSSMEYCGTNRRPIDSASDASWPWSGGKRTCRQLPASACLARLPSNASCRGRPSEARIPLLSSSAAFVCRREMAVTRERRSIVNHSLAAEGPIVGQLRDTTPGRRRSAPVGLAPRLALFRLHGTTSPAAGKRLIIARGVTFSAYESDKKEACSERDGGIRQAGEDRKRKRAPRYV